MDFLADLTDIVRGTVRAWRQGDKASKCLMNDFQRRFGHREREVVSADVLAILAAGLESKPVPAETMLRRTGAALSPTMSGNS